MKTSVVTAVFVIVLSILWAFAILVSLMLFTAGTHGDGAVVGYVYPFLLLSACALLTILAVVYVWRRTR